MWFYRCHSASYSIKTDGSFTYLCDIRDARQVGHQLGEKIAVNGLLNQCQLWQSEGIVCVGVGGQTHKYSDNHHAAALHAISSPEAFSEETATPCNSSLNLIL